MPQRRASPRLSAFLTLLNDRMGESIVFPLLPFLLAGISNDGRTIGLLAGSYAVPAPGAVALLGLAGLAGRRRRA